MPIRSMTYPHGQAVVSAILVRRSRAVPVDALVRVRTGDTVVSSQPIASLPNGEAVLAGIAGRVQQTPPGQVVVEGVARLMHGMLGLGDQVAGPLVLSPRPEDQSFRALPRGAILLVHGRLSPMHLQGAVQIGARGVIAGSISARDLEGFARVDLPAVLDGVTSYPASPLTLVLTDGIGGEPMDPRFANPLSSALGSVVLLSGVTRSRPLVRPEILLAATDPLPVGVPLPHSLTIGTRVHVHAGASRGAQGEIVALPGVPEMIENRLMVRCAYVRIPDGNVLRLPVNVLDPLT